MNANIASIMEQSFVAIKTEPIETGSQEMTEDRDNGFTKGNPMALESGERCCYICSELFDDSSDLMEHMINHRLQRSNTCPICSERFCRGRALKEHIMSHTGYRPYQCFVCSKGFKRASKLKDHMKTHTRKKCNSTHKVSETKGMPVVGSDGKASQKLHQNADDALSQDNQNCVKTGETLQKCGEMFLVSPQLMDHMMACQQEKANIFVVSNERLNQTGHLKEHLIDDSGSRPHNDGLINLSSLQDEMVQHKQGEDDTVSKVLESKVTVAGDTIKDISTGENSEDGDDDLCHNNSKSIKRDGERCYICGELFNDSSDLMEHMMIHRVQASTTCSMCGLRLASTRSLKRHMMKHTTSTPNTSDEIVKLSHDCPLCNEKFAESSLLQKHLPIHFTKEQGEHRCYHCCKVFQRPQDLYRHTMAHSCSVCNQSFCQLSYLNQHSKSHKGKEEFSKSNIKKGFKELSKLLKHEQSDDEMNLINSTDTAPGKIRLYSCTRCQKGFSNLDDAKAHVQTHVKKAPDKKLEVDKDLLMRAEGRSHTAGPTGHTDKHKLKILKTQSGKMLYLCSVCGEDFEALPTAYSHILGHGTSLVGQAHESMSK